jgi:hypothetical protein
VLPVPLVSAASTRSLALTPAPNCCHRAPRVARARRLPCSRAFAVPARRAPSATVRVAWSRRACALTAHAAPHPDPSLSAPLLSCPHVAPSRTPPYTFHPRRTTIKRCCPTPSLISLFSSHKRRCTTPPPPLPIDAPSTNGDREASDRTELRLFSPELRHRPLRR